MKASAVGVTLIAVQACQGSHSPLCKCSGAHTHCYTSTAGVMLTAIEREHPPSSPLPQCGRQIASEFAFSVTIGHGYLVVDDPLPGDWGRCVIGRSPTGRSS